MKIQSVYKELENSQGLLYAWFEALHSRIDLLLCGGKEKDLVHVAGSICEMAVEIEHISNFYHKNSELARLNNQAAMSPVEVSPELFDMISDCKNNSSFNGGCFDITIQSDNHSKETFSAVRLTSTSCTVFYEKEGIRIDLSGYVKGYVLDKAVAILADNNIEDALINIGNSSVMAKGNHPYGEGWKVGIRIPGEENGTKEILLKNQCLTTSGNDTAGRKHIISPFLGVYLQGIRLISVITEKGTTGEILSTALLIATPGQRKLIEANYQFDVAYETGSVSCVPVIN